MATEPSVTEQLGSPAYSKDSIDAAMADANSPQTSPKRKPSVSESGHSESSGPQKKADRKPGLRARIWTSLKKTVKRSESVAASSSHRGAVDLEASDFSFRQPPRGSPASGSGKKRASPSLELYSAKRRHRSSLAIELMKTAIEEDADGVPSQIRGGTPLHFYAWADADKKEKTDILVSLLTTAEVEVDCRTDDGNTPLHLAVKKGDLNAVKVLVAFGASVNATNNRGQTPLDLATVGYLNQERKLSLSNTALNRHLVARNPRECSPRLPHQRSFTENHRESPLLSRIVPIRPKFVDMDLDGDLDGWTCVDFTDVPPARAVTEKGVEVGSEVRFQDLTSPVSITMEENTQQPDHTANSSSSSSHSVTQRQVSTTKSRSRSVTVKEDEKLRRSFDDILNLLHATGGMTRHRLQQSPMKPISLSGKHILPDLSMELQRSIRLAEYEEGSTILNLYEALQDTINRKMENLSAGNLDEAIALALQQKEMKEYNKTLQMVVTEEVVDGDMRAKAGSRVLCLDGGGIRGLIQVEVLSLIERETGHKIVDLFDWIIGTSTGAVIALALTYGDKSVEEVRQLYFKMKSEVFTGGSYGFNTDMLEKILQETFPSHMTMNCPTTHSTNVLVAAVYKKMSPPELHFFNNCFHDQYSTQPVWKVARYTTAAPMFFHECDDYVDGGVLANNPSEAGLTAIQNFHRSRGIHIPIALVVSVGSGIYPAEELGRIDVQDFMFFGRQWLSFQDTVRSRAKNLIQLLSNALVESEMVAKNTKARCEGQGTPYYRFSPKLAETVATGETDNGILINMLIATIVQTIPQLDSIHQQFLRIAEANQKDRFRKRREL